MSTRKLTTEQFIERARKVHGNSYDYSKTKYLNARSKVTITCPDHGDFNPVAGRHLLGVLCYKCGIKVGSEKQRSTTSEFIKKANELHLGEYDYSLVDYINARVKYDIICKNHGIFKQSANNHLKGVGCPKCADEFRSEKFISDKDVFIKKCIINHGDRYDYSLVDYKGANRKVKIICKVHGVFEQKAANHSNTKRGCPKCARELITENIRKNPTGWSCKNWENKAKISKNFDSFKVYIIKCYNDNELFYKVGRTFLCIKERFRSKISMPYNYEVMQEFVFDTAREAFNKEVILKSINKKNIYMPSISFSGKYECFSEINETN